MESNDKRQPKQHHSILIIGSRLHSDGYPRNQEIINALEDSGYTLYWCALPYPSFFHRWGLPLRLGFIIAYTPLRWIYALLLSIYHRMKEPVSHVYVPFPAHLDLPLAWVAAKINGAKLVADVFLGIYNTLIQDRKILPEKNIFTRVLYHSERILLRFPDVGLIDTEDHKRLLKGLFKHSGINLTVVPIAIDEEIFTHSTPDRSDKVVFWGTYIRLHGTETIVQAAALTQVVEPSIRFEMIGKGQELHAAKQLAEELHINNIDFVEKILPISEVVQRARTSFCVLGIFGSSQKSASVFPYKAVQSLALGLPLITAATPASTSILVHEHDALLVPPGNPKALSEKIVQLYNNHELGLSLSQNGRIIYDKNFSRKSIGSALQGVFNDQQA